MAVSEEIPQISVVGVGEGSGAATFNESSLPFPTENESRLSSKTVVDSRKSSKSRVKPPPTLVQALKSKGALNLATFLALREGVRLAFVCRGFDRVQIQRVALETCISVADLVPNGFRRQELIPLAVHHLSHCWGSALRTLDLSGCVFLLDFDIQRLFSGLWELLLDLRLVDCNRISDLGVKSVVEACHYLKALYLTGLELLTEASMTYVVANCSRLEHINLGRCTRIPDAGLEALFSGCSLLQIFDVHDNHLITDASLKALVRGCKHIRGLNFQKCIRLTDKGMQRMAESLSDALEALNVSDDRLSDWGIRPVIESSRLMRVLKMRKCGSDVTLCSVAICCNLLLTLDVSDCYRAVTDVGLQVVNEGCPLLCEFSAENCMSITGVGVQALALGCHDLRFVNLSGCNAVGDVGVVALGTSCPKLEQVNLCRCVLVSDLGICALGEGCRSLRGLVLSFCEQVTDAGMDSLAGGCPELEHLNLFECKCITDKGLLAFLENGFMFKSLQTDGCDLRDPVPPIVIQPPQQILQEEHVCSHSSSARSGSDSAASRSEAASGRSHTFKEEQ